jgi:hypothetical protein
VGCPEEGGQKNRERREQRHASARLAAGEPPSPRPSHHNRLVEGRRIVQTLGARRRRP